MSLRYTLIALSILLTGLVKAQIFENYSVYALAPGYKFFRR